LAFHGLLRLTAYLSYLLIKRIKGDNDMNIELRKLKIMNRIAKLESRGNNEPIIKKKHRELRRLGA
jgi:hypothetical protein